MRADDTAARAASVASAAGTSALVRDALRILAAGDHLDEVLRQCADALVQRLGAALARVWVLDRRGGDQLVLRASVGGDAPIAGDGTRVRVGERPVGRIAQSRTAHVTAAVLDDDSFVDPDWPRANGITSFAGLPLVVGERLVGVVTAFRETAWTDDELEALEALAEALAAGIERMQSTAHEREMAETLHLVGRSLVSELELDRTVQTVTDAATRLTGAMYGAFFYNVVDERGESLYAVLAVGHRSGEVPTVPAPAEHARLRTDVRR